MSILCSEHTDEEVRFRCEECDRLVCEECVLGNCATHTKIRLRQYIARKKETLKEILSEIEEKEIPNVKKNISEVKEKQKEFIVKIDEMILRVKSRTDALKMKLTEVNDEIILDLNDKKKSATEEFDRYLEIENNKLMHLESKTKERNWDSPTDADILKIDIENEKVDKSPAKKPVVCAPLYTYVEQDEKVAIKKLHGFFDEQNVYEDIMYHIETVTEDVITGSDWEDVKINISFKQYLEQFNIPKDIFSISVKGTKNCWISGKDSIWEVTYENELKIEERYKMDFTHSDIAFVEGMGLLVACLEKRHIKCLKPRSGSLFRSKKNDFQMEKILSTEPFLPLCLCTTPSEDLLVCLRSSPTEESHGKSILRRHSVSSRSVKVLQEVELSTEELQIYSPVCIAASVTEDISILTKTDGIISQLVCLTSDGNLKFRYPTDGLAGHNFVGISCLKDGTIVLLDRNPGKCGLYFVDKSGSFLLFEPKDPSPRCLSVDSAENIWIGYESGQVETITPVFECGYPENTHL